MSNSNSENFSLINVKWFIAAYKLEESQKDLVAEPPLSMLNYKQSDLREGNHGS
jgi:hypothetical protein